MPSRGGEREDLKRGNTKGCQRTEFLGLLLAGEVLALLSLSVSTINLLNSLTIFLPLNSLSCREKEPGTLRQ
jgi:hypothetical protein